MMIMSEIKEFKELVSIKLKDGRVITTETPIETVAKMLNTNDFIVLGGIGFGKYEVCVFEKFIPTEIDNFIYSQSDKSIQEKLLEIVTERKAKWLSINWIKHLWNIYLSKYTENADNSK